MVIEALFLSKERLLLTKVSGRFLGFG